MGFLDFLGMNDDPWLKYQELVNYRGDKLSDSEVKGLSVMESLGGFGGSKVSTMLNNWLTGGRPPAVDIGVTLARSAALAGVKQQAGAGMGFSGAFGLGKILGFGLPSPALAGFSSPGSPMQAGTPYSVPPIPDLMPKGAR